MGAVSGFTARHGIKTLVWYEAYSSVAEAIAQEKRIKRWRRKWKLELIETMNLSWRNLYEALNQ